MKTPTSKAQKPRVRKLKPLTKPEPQLHHLPQGQQDIKSRWQKSPTSEALSRQRREVTRLQELMADAIAARQLSRVEAIMEQLLSIVEREDGGRGGKAEESFRAEVIAYLDQCQVDLKALAEQEEVERKHQRFHGNELMKRAVELLHASPADEQTVRNGLDQAEQAYRRAHDRRAECIPGIRHKVAADARMSEASRRFDACEISAAIAIAQSASEQYAAFRTSPTYQGSQLLLSLSEGAEPWNERPLRELSHTNDDLDRCFEDVEAYFQDKARAKASSLYQESKRCVDERRYADARDALTRCEAYQNWLQEPLPAAVVKYKRQLLRTELARELQALLEDANAHGRATRLLKWAYDCVNGLIPADDLVESGILRFALTLASGLESDGDNRVETAISVMKLLDAIVGGGNGINVLKHQSSGDSKTVILALLRLAETLETSVDRTKAVKLLCGLVDSKQAVHVAIHKCAVLEMWRQLRDANTSAVDVLVVLIELLHQLIATLFPLFLPAILSSSAVRGVVSTFARHYKQPTVALACGSIFMVLSTAPDQTMEALAPMESGLTSSLVNAQRHYAQEPTTDNVAVGVLLVAIVFSLCGLDLPFAKAMESAKIPAMISTRAKNPVWQIPPEHARYFEPKQFRKFLQERSAQPVQPPKLSTSTSQKPLKSSLQLKTAPLDGSNVNRVCAARFGVSLKLKSAHQFCLVRFLAPQDLSQSSAEHCRVAVTTLGTRTHTQTFTFPAHNPVYSIAVLRRELVRPSSPRARCDFFLSLLTSLLPIPHPNSSI